MQVLVFPEDIQDRSPPENPMYATVVAPGATVATLSLLSDPVGRRVRVPSSIIGARQVADGEFEAGAPGEWLRKGAFGLVDGRYVYGQVVAYTREQLTLRDHTADHVCPRDLVTEVAPVVCMLMDRADLHDQDVAIDQLTGRHNLILDRQLGQNGTSATKSIPRLLGGIVPSRDQPTSSDRFTWISPTLGSESEVTLRHAVDFAYYVDGNRRVPSSMTDKIGSRFDEDPTVTAAAPVSTSSRNSQVAVTPQAASTSSTPADTRDEDDALMALLASIENPRRDVPTARSTTTITPTEAPELRSRVLTAIADDPALIRYYIAQCEALDGNKRHAGTYTGPATQRRRLDAASDLIDLHGASDRVRTKHAFHPTRQQQAIQGLLASDDYAGKNPAELMDLMVSSRATKFKPHPAILSSVFDFQFGLRGLSIMHFERFDLTARRNWYAEGSVNMNNFSVAIELPRARKPRSLRDLSDALAVLLVFVEEFMDAHTRNLLSAAKEFVEDIREYGAWHDRDVESIAYWFDNVLEDFRRAAEYDTGHTTCTRGDVRARFSMQDPSLQSMLYVIQSERLASLSVSPHPPSRQGGSDAPRPADGGRRVDLRTKRSTPQDVLDAIPRQGRSTLCLKFISAQGCVSKSPDRCAFPSRAHFVPQSLPTVVRRHVVENLGGLRPDLQL